MFSPEEEFGPELQGMMEPYKKALVELAQALKNNPDLASSSSAIEAYRMVADRTVHSVTGVDSKTLFFDAINAVIKQNPNLEQQLRYIEANIVI